MSSPAPGVLRTPDARFAGLLEWPFPPRYLTLDGLPGLPGPLRLHYVDEGPQDAAETVLLLHGEPSWSYLYRRMIPPLAERHRVLAFDFPGFGRSDKPARVRAYTYDLHRQTLVRFIEALDLRDVTLVVQDWGGLTGLPVAALDVPDRVARLVVLNTFLPTGEERPGLSFKVWRWSVAVLRRRLPIGPLMRLALPRSQAYAVPAYTAPFPSGRYKAGAVAWPLLVPRRPDSPVADVMREARAALAEWTKPALVLFAPDDPILGRLAPFFRRLIPSASAQPEVSVRGGHFLQDKSGPEIARHVLDFIDRTPRAAGGA